MNKRLTKVLIASLVLPMLYACSAKKMGVLLGNATGTKVAYSSIECEKIKQACPVFEYQEWQTSEHKMGCSCNKQSQ